MPRARWPSEPARTPRIHDLKRRPAVPCQKDCRSIFKPTTSHPRKVDAVMGTLPFTVLPPAQPRKLHDYQQGVVDRLDAACATAIRRALLVMPTGSGKTIVAAEIARRAVATGQRVLFLVHK